MYARAVTFRHRPVSMTAMPHFRSLPNRVTTPFRISIFSAVIALGLVTSVRAEIPALLKDALAAFADGDGLYWAYTETSTPSVVNSKGKPFMADQLKLEATKTRIDPSKPYAEQYAPLELGGKAPSQKRVAECLQLGEKESRAAEQFTQEHAPVTAAAAEAIQNNNPDEAIHIEVTNSGFDIEHPTVVADDSLCTTYRIPLTMKKKADFNLENFDMFVRVNKEQRVVENILMRLKKPVRIKLIVKIKTLEVSVDFRRIQPNLPPAIVALKCTGEGSFFFKTVKGSLTTTYEEHARVKSFDKRFHVNAGPLQFLKF